LVVLFVISLNGNAQWLSLGVTGGVPVSPHAAFYSAATISLNPSSSDQPNATNLVTFQGPNDFYQKPYAVGPALEVNLPLRLSLGIGMLYERFHRDMSEGITPIRGGGNVIFGYVTSVAANAFAFPLLVKYNFSHPRIRPFIEAGATLRHLGNFEGEGFQLDIHLHPTARRFRFDPDKAVDVAVTVGAGLRYRLGLADVVPEVRYLHWTAQYEQPAQDQAMLMLTVSFPARR
jgi:hypothetical protein